MQASLKARRLAERVWLRIWNGFTRMWGGDPQGALPASLTASGPPRRFDDADLLTMSALGEGMCLVLAGQGPAGLALLDEFMVGVTSGEVSPM